VDQGWNITSGHYGSKLKGKWANGKGKKDFKGRALYYSSICNPPIQQPLAKDLQAAAARAME
jgi:hypothetical protein